MFKKVLAFLCSVLLLNISLAHAQTDFRPGYIVRLSGDTVRGLADYRGAARSSRLCEFRTAAGAASTSYAPEELRAFGFPGSKEYRSRLTPLPDSLDKPVPPRLFFLEILADGPAALYARRDRLNATYYYLQKGAASIAPVQVLVYRREIVETGTQRVYRDVNTFRNTLSEAFTDCPALSLDVLRTEFIPSALARIVTRYNACTQPAAAPAAPLRRRKTRLTVGVLAGAQVSQLTFPSDTYQGQGTFFAKPAPVAGLTVQAVFPGLSEKLALRVEALYAPQQYEDNFTYYLGYITATASEQARYKATYLRLPVMLRYNTLVGRVRSFVDAGVTFSRALTLETEHTVTYSILLPTEGPAPIFSERALKKKEFGLFAGIGAQLPVSSTRALSIMGRVEHSNGITTVRNPSQVWRYQLLLGMNLTK